MALLSSNAIRAALEQRALVIDPLPKEEDFDSDSVDVHLGERIYRWRQLEGGATMTIPLWRANEPGRPFVYRRFSDENLQLVPADADGIITLRPQTFYLADLRQHTRLPPNLAMHVQGKSSLARIGVGVHVTAPHAHAGWHGRLTLEIYNFGPFNVELKPGVALAQLYFWQVDDPVPPGLLKAQQFTGQDTATGA